MTTPEGTTVTDTTDANGEVTLEDSFSGMELFATKTVMVSATKSGFTQSPPVPQEVTAIAVATIDVNLVLTPSLSHKPGS